MRNPLTWHALSEEESLRELNSDPAYGLTQEEAERRLSIFGSNELKKEARLSPLKLLFGQFADSLMVILLLATLLSALLGEIFDAALIFIIVVFSAGLGFMQEYRAEKALKALKQMFSPMVTVLRNGLEEEIPAARVVPGDILLLEAGDRMPADARVLDAKSLLADEASLTGESVPGEKTIGILPAETLLADRTNMLFAGTIIAYGRGKAVATATGMNTHLGEIAREVSAIKAEKTPLELRTAEIGKRLGVAALLICLVVAALSIVRQAASGVLTIDFIFNIVLFAVALAVAAVPEALAAIVTGALAIGMREMAKRKALIRRMPAVETLGSVTVICSDKTGTITKGEMSVRQIYFDGDFVDVSGVGYEPVGTFSPRGAERKLESILLAGLLCNDAELRQVEGRWQIKGDPTEGALVVLAVKAGLDISNLRLENVRFEEIPFSSERKRMITIHTMAHGTKIAFMKGAPEVVLKQCSHIMREGKHIALDEGQRRAMLSISEKMAREGLRVLAIAQKGLRREEATAVESGMTFLGIFGMMDAPRDDAKDAVRICREVGIRPVMITGDHILTAVAIAKEVDIYREGDIALSGEELEMLSEEELSSKVKEVSVYARVSPMDKLKIVKAWKKNGGVVAMTGDGVNDAPALKHADIGVAMGITGTDVAKEASDMILLDDNFATIIKAIERGRWIYDNIKKYLTALLSANFVEVLVLGGVVIVDGPQYLPLLPPAILYINIVTDGLPALALGVSPAEPDAMKQPPRDPAESVFSKDVLIFIGLTTLILGPILFYAFFTAPDVERGRTEVFFLMILGELAIALNLRSLRHSIFRASPHLLLILSVISSVVFTFLIAEFPKVRDAFGIRHFAIMDLAYMIALVLTVTSAFEVAKFFLRQHSNRKSSKGVWK